ncbi:MAG: hypothetical protein CBB71_03005 [Rhodopirellula sp. TMED11]|nr:MAG: hypothetical protein CBB71_03005 [Rhodopirellula sp. TMED11]
MDPTINACSTGGFGYNGFPQGWPLVTLRVPPALPCPISCRNATPSRHSVACQLIADHALAGHQAGWQN